MDERPTKKRKEKPLLAELTYRQVDLGWTAIPALDLAFDILFDEVLRRRESNAKTYPQKDIDT